MVIKKDINEIKCTGDKITSDVIIASGEFFSGSISFSNDKNNWLVFNLVNKEKMMYILKDIKFNKEVKFEILTYDVHPKKVQYSNNWDKLDKK
jgi:hypothetical protein